MATINKAFRVKTGLAVEGGAVSPAAGTTSYPPILLTSGTNLTSATAGAFEYDGTNFYLTPSSTRKTISFTDHVHGNITAAGAIGSTSGLVVLTGSSGVLTTLAAGTTSQYLRGDGSWQTVSTTDTNYYPSAIVFTGGTTSGPTLDLTMSGDGAPDITAVAIPSASASASGVVTTGAQTFAGVKTFDSSPIVPTPTNSTDAANKAYVDNAIVGIDWKPSVNVATTGALGTTGNLVGGTITTTYSNGTSGVGATLTIATSSNWTSTTIDGSGTPIGSRVLIKDQANSVYNGIYTVTQLGTTSNSTSFIFTRATDSDTTAELTSGHAVFVEYGTLNADSGWTCISDGTNIVGTSGLTYTQFTGLGQVTAGTGLTKSENTISVDSSVIPSLTSTTYVGTTSIALNRSSAAQGLTGISSIENSGGSVSIGASSATTVNIGNSSAQLNISHGDAYEPIVITGGGGAAIIKSFGGANTSQSLTIETGTPTGTNQSSGGIYLESGTPTGTGEHGEITIGLNNTSGQIKIGPENAPDSGKTQVTTIMGSDSLYLDNNVGNGFIGIAALANSLAGTSVQIGRNDGSVTLALKGSTTLYNSVKMSGLSSGAGTRFVKMSDAGVLSYEVASYTTTSNKLSDFAATSSSELKTVISDETGTGALVFAGSPALTGTPTVNSIAGFVTASGSGSSLFTMSSIFDKTVYNGGEFTVKLSDGTDFEIIRMLVVIKGTTVYVTQYGDVQSNTALGTIDFTLSTNNVNMTVTPAAGTVTAKVVGTLLVA